MQIQYILMGLPRSSLVSYFNLCDLILYLLCFKAVLDVEGARSGNNGKPNERDLPPKYEDVAEIPPKYDEATMKPNEV